MTHSRTILPTLSQAGSSWPFSCLRSDLSQDATSQVVEYSSDLKIWTAISIPVLSGNGVIITQEGLSDSVSVVIPAAVGQPTFARLKVSQ